MSKKIAIIPARSGSTRIKNKNTRLFSNTSLLNICIKTVQKTKLFDHIFLLTDSMEIADSVKDKNIEIPYLRSSNTSDDYATLKDVINEFIDRYECIEQDIEFLCCVLCTSPFTKPDSIKEGLKLINKHNSHCVISVAEYSHPLERSFELNESKRIVNLNEKNITKRTQDCNKKYFDAGQFYWINLKKYDLSNELISKSSDTIVIPYNEICDIDDIEEFKFAEQKYNYLKKNNK